MPDQSVEDAKAVSHLSPMFAELMQAITFTDDERRALETVDDLLYRIFDACNTFAGKVVGLGMPPHEFPPLACAILASPAVSMAAECRDASSFLGKFSDAQSMNERIATAAGWKDRG